MAQTAPRPKTEARLRDCRIHYRQWGARGPRVLLVHAIGFDHHSWDGVARLLQDDCQLVALDLPGHGRSDKPAGADYNLWALGERVGQFLEELGWEDAFLVGNSIGGGTVLSLAVQHPERARALALVNSVAFRAGLPLVGRLGGLPLLPLVSGYVPPLFVRLGLGTVHCDWRKVSADRTRLCCDYFKAAEGRAAFFRMLGQLYGPDLERMAEHYREIRCPTLILHGERDWLIRLAHAERLSRTIPGAELVRIPRCGHFPSEECPEIVARELRRFFSRVEGNGRN